MIKDIYLTASSLEHISPEEIKVVYESFWSYIRDSINSLPLKQNLTEEEFNTLSTNFNIPSLGKLYCTYDDYRNSKRRKDIANKYEYKKDKTFI